MNPLRYTIYVYKHTYIVCLCILQIFLNSENLLSIKKGKTFKTIMLNRPVQFSSAQLLSGVQLFVTPWTATRLASLSITNSRSLLKLMSIESVMPSNHLILCHPLLLPSIFLSIRVFLNESALCIRGRAEVLEFQLQNQSFQ